MMAWKTLRSARLARPLDVWLAVVWDARDYTQIDRNAKRLQRYKWRQFVRLQAYGAI